MSDYRRARFGGGGVGGRQVLLGAVPGSSGLATEGTWTSAEVSRQVGGARRAWLFPPWAGGGAVLAPGGGQAGRPLQPGDCWPSG